MISSLSGRKVFLISVVFLSTVSAYAQTVLTISGDVTKPLTLQATDLKAIPHTTVVGKDKDGKEHQYSGVRLVDLLKLARATLGGELRGENLVKYAVVKAIDGYNVLFALAEIDPEFATRTILLADSVDGKPLPQGVGPYRVIVPDEKKPARWIREVNAIEIRSGR